MLFNFPAERGRNLRSISLDSSRISSPQLICIITFNPGTLALRSLLGTALAHRS